MARRRSWTLVTCTIAGRSPLPARISAKAMNVTGTRTPKYRASADAGASPARSAACVWNGIAASMSANATNSSTMSNTIVVAGWSFGRLAARARAPRPSDPPSTTNEKCRTAASTLRFRWTWNVNVPTGTSNPSTSTARMTIGEVATRTASTTAPVTSAEGKKL